MRRQRQACASLSPAFLGAGTRSGVGCAPLNASTSGQWRPLMELLAPKFRILSPIRDSGRPALVGPVIHLRDGRAIEPVLRLARR
jgi:hypothetical protein